MRSESRPRPVDEKLALAAVNVLGGIAVLGSYAYGILGYPELRASFWGGVPDWLRPWYVASMLLATAGYLCFTYFFALRTDPRAVRIGQSLRYRTLVWIYAGILLPSALWMPLTVRVLEDPRPWAWLATRTVLAITGVSSLALVAVLAAMRPRVPRVSYGLAVAGSVAFSIQTAVLDAIVWPAYFR
jgi:hypothetical protein